MLAKTSIVALKINIPVAGNPVPIYRLHSKKCNSSIGISLTIPTESKALDQGHQK
jgi:hypothetical protein